MLQIDKIDTSNKAQINEFIRLPFRLYNKCSQWVPPFIVDIKTMLNRDKHPFYEHSDAEFYVARRNGQVVGRIAVAVNNPFNKYHDTKKAQFYLFECEDEQDVADALFNRGFEWCHAHGLNQIVGPKGFSAFDGYGIQIEGFEHHQMMTMMNYNHPYYVDLVTHLGFEKEVDFVSCYIRSDEFVLPEKIQKVVQIVRKRGAFQVKNFSSKKELIAWAPRIGEAYNKTFINNWEYYPFSRAEVKFMLDNLLVVAVPKLIKVITYQDELVGFLLGFPDITKALQRSKGQITPWGLVDMSVSLKRTNWISLNGVGVLPEYHGRGANVLLYDEMKKTISDYGYEHAELTQMAESATQVRQDIITVGAKPYKNHRVYHKTI